MRIAMDVPERGRPETTMIGAPNRIERYSRVSGNMASDMIAAGLGAPPNILPMTDVHPLFRPSFGARAVLGAVAVGLVLATPAVAEAYVGPGAGFVLLSSFFAFLTTVVVAMLSLLVWPFRKLWRLLRRPRHGRPSIRRLVIVGLDGQDPTLTERY